jgi:TPR repeat protein
VSAQPFIFPQSPPLDSGAVLGGTAGVCRSCGARIAVPETARFCPRCGTSLRAAGISPAETDAVDRLAAIREAEQALPPLARAESEKEEPPFARLASADTAADNPSDDLAADGQAFPVSPPTAPRCFHSDVLIAYASALFRLGWRYERGHGAPRNVAEAIRCYHKSARLGNPAAAARLDGRPS